MGKYLDPEKERETRRRYREANRANQREYERTWRKRHPEKAREKRKRDKERLRQDPERYQASLDAQRMQYRLRKERKGEGLEVRQTKGAKGAYRTLTDNHASRHDERIEAAPFFAWLDVWQEQRKETDKINDTRAEVAPLEDLCRLAGFSVKRLSESRLKGVIRLAIAEAFLDVVDGPQLWEIYDEEPA